MTENHGVGGSIPSLGTIRPIRDATLGVPAQTVGEKASKRMAGYLTSSTVAGPYLADQLLLHMALAGSGSFTTVKPSAHARTAADVISRFLDVQITFEEREDGCHLVTLN